MHTTMQTLGRVAIIGGSVLVSLVNLYSLLRQRSPARSGKGAICTADIYLMALAIPAISVAGVLLAACCSKRREARRRRAQGFDPGSVLAPALDQRRPTGGFSAAAPPSSPSRWRMGLFDLRSIRKSSSSAPSSSSPS
jgi:hypothetical protein